MSTSGEEAASPVGDKGRLRWTGSAPSFFRPLPRARNGRSVSTAPARRTEASKHRRAECPGQSFAATRGRGRLGWAGRFGRLLGPKTAPRRVKKRKRDGTNVAIQETCGACCSLSLGG